MKFKSDQGILAEAFAALARVASSRNAGTPALAGVKMVLTGDTLVAASTNQEMSLQFSVPVAGDTDGQGLVSAKTINDIVRVMPSGKITVEFAGENATVTAQRSQFTIPTMNAIEFPRQPTPTGEPVTLTSAAFKDALDQVVLAASGEPHRLHLSAVMMTATDNGIRLVATDGYRLAMRDIVGASGVSSDHFLIPKAAFSELQRLLDISDEITIRFNESDASFQSQTMTLATKLINAEYPPYQNIIPNDNTNEAVINREELLVALRRSRVLASDLTPVRVRMSSEGVRLTVTLTDGSTSVEDLDAKFTGEDITVAFNPDYLADGVNACGTEEICISTKVPNKPAIIRPVGNSDYLYLLMPQRS